MRIAVVKDGVVVNIVSANKLEHVALRYPDCTVVDCGKDIEAGVGMLYDGETFTYPES